MFREATEEEKRKEQELVDDLYDQFLDAVAEGRDMDKAKVKEVATGEVFTGRVTCTGLASSTSSATSNAPSTSPPSSATPRKPVWMRPKKSLREAVAAGRDLIRGRGREPPVRPPAGAGLFPAQVADPQSLGQGQRRSYR